MYDDDLAGAIAMRMGVLFRRAAVGCPACVTDAEGAFERCDPDGFFKIAELALRAADLQAVSIAADGDARGIISAVFQAAQPVNDDGDHLLISDIANNSAHKVLPGLKPDCC